MSKRHFTMLPDRSYKCVSCRQEFSSRKELGKHYGLNGKCKHPITMGLHLDVETSHYRWTANKPESIAVRLSKAA